MADNWKTQAKAAQYDLLQAKNAKLRAALIAGRVYVECCCEPHGKDGASKALKQIDAVLAD